MGVRVVPGSYEEALDHGHSLLEGYPDAALSQAKTLLRSGPEARALRLSAAAYRNLGRAEEAEEAELAAIRAGFSDRELERAAVAQHDGQTLDAKIIIERFLDRHPDDLLALTISADIAIELWDLERAEQMLRLVGSRAPTYLRAAVLLATCLTKQVRMREAIASLEKLSRPEFDNVAVLALLAKLRAEVRDIDEATSIHEKLVSLQEDRAERWINLGQYYRILGRKPDSISAFRRALKIDPVNGSAWWSLSNYYLDELERSDEQAIVHALSQRIGEPDEAPLQLALGNIADRAADHPTAFDHFVAGKKARLSSHPYDSGPITAAVDGLINTFTPAFYERRWMSGCPDPSPVFIIGMPRSGTTLVERILGRHSAIEDLGELQVMPRLAERARHEARNPEHYAAMLEELSERQLATIGERYIKASEDYRKSATELFVDKNNLNWMHIGTIMLSLTNARIIDVRRDALDCCWSNFKMLFAEGFPAANDLRDVGRFYCDYVRLLDAMNQAAPGRMLSLRYEDLVDDIESQTRRMLDFLGLDYEPDCIDFHLATGAVATASSEQVRRPLNREGIGAWRQYEQWLGPLREALGPLADA